MDSINEEKQERMNVLISYIRASRGLPRTPLFCLPRDFNHRSFTAFNLAILRTRHHFFPEFTSYEVYTLSPINPFSSLTLLQPHNQPFNVLHIKGELDLKRC